jgi:glycosyltransferase involved in cell wall biosynthesis
VSVGVIVPCRGDVPWLAEALDSVLAQDPPADRVVVVDDGSPAPLELEPRHAQACRLVRLEDHAGLTAARVAGLEKLGDVEWIAFCDADDVWRPGKLAAQLARLERTGADMCFTAVEVIGPDGVATGERGAAAPEGIVDSPRWTAYLYEHNPVIVSSALLRREALERAGGFLGAERFHGGEDLDLWLRLATSGARFAWEPSELLRYRRHPGQMTADIASLAEFSLAVHEAHGELVDAATRRRVRARDLRTMARGRIRQRRYPEAREALRRAAELEPLGPRDRVIALALRLPGARALLGRRDPYRPRRA